MPPAGAPVHARPRPQPQPPLAAALQAPGGGLQGLGGVQGMCWLEWEGLGATHVQDRRSSCEPHPFMDTHTNPQITRVAEEAAPGVTLLQAITPKNEEGITHARRQQTGSPRFRAAGATRAPGGPPQPCPPSCPTEFKRKKEEGDTVARSAQTRQSQAATPQYCDPMALHH